jgi:peptidyl-prolyl cis-trans isomerase C
MMFHSPALYRALFCFILAISMLATFADAKSAESKSKERADKVAAVTGATDVSATLEQPFVTVNGETQSNARAEVLLREQIVRGVKDSSELRAAVRQGLINQAVMAQAARNANLDKNPLIQARVELARQDILAQAWQQILIADRSFKEDEIRAEYDRQLASLGDKDYQIRHLLLKDEATARLLLDKIKAGSKIVDLAAEFSLDGATRERGGLADWANSSALLAPLADTIKPLTKGQMATNPVKTDSGWHVLQLEDIRTSQTLNYDQARPQMLNLLSRRLIDEQLQAIVKQAKVK